jgi:hypothetical protein
MTLLLFRFGFFGIAVKLLIVAGLVGMYLYAKLAPHKDKLDAKHRGWFDTGDKIFGGLSRAIGGNMKPYKVGEGIFLDMGQLILFFIIAGLALITMVGM